MKILVCAALIAFAAPVVTAAQDFKGGNTKGADHKSASTVSKGGTTYRATGTVKEVDKAKSTVKLAHGPVKELKWPSMTMSFAVKDKSLLDALAAGKTVEFEFVQVGKDYVVTSVR
jgi:Cu(I)/Ag(I) efflux system periplasmic protein CusF